MTAAAREVLPVTVRPRHYTVELAPDLAAFTFEGRIEVQLDVAETTRTVVCNANELDVKSAKIVADGHVQKCARIELVAKDEQVVFHLETALAAGTKAVLHAEFSGVLNDKMAGFYRSGYTDAGGQQRHMAVTQFEATDARRAFPCWDEPALKATFDVALVVPAPLVALSNMNVVGETPAGEGRKRVAFATTPLMSTYLVAFVVGDLEHVETVARPTAPAAAQPIVVRVYTLPGQKAQGEFALGVAARTLEFFSAYFDIPYPLPKMDLVAIPDFSAGAMENWGLVTYRTIYLLYDPKSSAAKSKEHVAYVVGHELAHQWFGNLVTMEWWEHLWLNEGFATYVGWLAVDHLHPEWQIWTQFVTDDLQRGLTLDALKSSHAIEVAVRSPAEITQIFDAISYSKGASVIRMLATYLGQDVFVSGVRAYLKSFAYANASTNDLWRHLGEASGQDVAALMHNWTRETGYPVVAVESATPSADEKSVALAVSQRRYLSDGHVGKEDDRVTWWVPVTVQGGSRDATAREILSAKSATLTAPCAATANGLFYKVNVDQTGFYRVRYPPGHLAVLGREAAARLGMGDRIGLVTDAFALAISGEGSTVDALELVRALEREDQYIVLSEIASRLAAVQSAFYQEAATVAGLRRLGAAVFAPIVKQLGFDYAAGEDHLVTQKRTLAISLAGKAGDAGVLAEIRTRFARFIAGDDSALSPNLRGTAFALVLRHVEAGEPAAAAHDAVLRIYREAPTVDQKLAALAALGACPHPAQVARTLELALDTALVRPQDVIYPLGTLARDNPSAATVRPQLWTWFKAHWPTLHERYHSSLSLLGRCLSVAREDSIGESAARELEDWAAAKGESKDAQALRAEQTKGITRNITQTLERVRGNTAWVARDRAAVADWVGKL